MSFRLSGGHGKRAHHDRVTGFEVESFVYTSAQTWPNTVLGRPEESCRKYLKDYKYIYTPCLRRFVQPCCLNGILFVKKVKE